MSKSNMSSGVQPQAIMQPLFSSTIHLINLFTISKKLEGWSVSNLLSCFRTFINICVYKWKLWEFVAQSTESRQNLTANATPEKNRENNISDTVNHVFFILCGRNCQTTCLKIDIINTLQHYNWKVSTLSDGGNGIWILSNSNVCCSLYHIIQRLS